MLRERQKWFPGGVNQRILGVLTSGHVCLVASYAASSILRVLTQWGATLVISLKGVPEFNTPNVGRMDEGGLFGEGGFLGSDYDSDDNSTAARVHRFFVKVEGLGIDLGEDMFSDPWA